jgi:hypothetical protein
MIFEEVQRLLDTSKDIKIPAKYLEAIPEEKMESEAQNILKKFTIRRLSAFIGQGAYSYGTWNTYITE